MDYIYDAFMVLLLLEYPSYVNNIQFIVFSFVSQRVWIVWSHMELEQLKFLLLIELFLFVSNMTFTQ